MSRTILVLFTFCCMLATLVKAITPTQSEKSEVRYKVGQMWSYKARSHEEKSYFIIVKIESDSKLGTIVHIAMRGLRMKNSRSPDGISDTVNHMPFTEEAVKRSSLKLLKEKVEW